MPDQHQPVDLVIHFLDNRQQLPRRGVIDTLIVAWRKARQLGGFCGANRGAAQHKVGGEAKFADFGTHPLGIDLPALSQPPVEIPASLRVPLGLGMAQQAQAFHCSLPTVVG